MRWIMRLLRGSQPVPIADAHRWEDLRRDEPELFKLAIDIGNISPETTVDVQTPVHRT